eukprot:COSAG05_NODE_11835_length_494_cov_0.653165_1_plen_23_part_10
MSNDLISFELFSYMFSYICRGTG